MYEDRTYEILLQRSLARVDTTVDKREGSIVYNGIAPVCVELQNMYIALDGVLNESFADTESREYLIRRAAERGIIPDAATYAILKGVFNIDVAIGARFSLDNLNYVVTEKISIGVYKLQCETAGVIGNSNFGALIPIDYIQGLTSCELTELLIPGEDEQATEDLRTEYYNSYDSQAFGGNRADYKKMFKDDVAGIGGIKIYRAWNGGGTVKIVIITSDFKKPTTILVDTVQTQVDPLVNQGEGLGLAPIDHKVTIFAIAEETVNITTTITYQSGWNFAACQTYIQNAIDAYYLELAKTWADNDNLIVRISQIETRLLNVAGILDIANTSINGVQANLVVDADSIPIRGTFVG